MYKELGGKLNTDSSIGYDPLACYDHFQESREHLIFSRNSSFASIFCDFVHNRIDTFVTAISNVNRTEWSTIQGVIGRVI